MEEPKTTLESLEEQIKVVAEARNVARIAQEAKKLLMDEWLQRHTEMLTDVVNKAIVVNKAEALLRELTLKAYNADPEKNKKPAEGVGIREVITYEYNSVNALDWAKSHKMALKLDTTAFEKLVKATPKDFKFVKSKTEPQATIAGNLEGV
ncbi:hypothetical protein LCGC14_0981180 [marine sediment metagenome]|uniref:Uncharacterized protein n=1 Tax=marine sediment metagenome TaxID=412755 RepID=A0A0F9QS38_9ZZZZ